MPLQTDKLTPLESAKNRASKFAMNLLLNAAITETLNAMEDMRLEGQELLKQFKASEANWLREEKELKTKRKVLVGRAKTLVSKQKSFGGELGVLEEMKKQLGQSQSQDVLEGIALLEAEVGNYENQRGVVEAAYEQQHVDVTVLTQDLNAKEAALSRQEGVVAKLQRELSAAGKINQGDSLACYPGARQVENEINRQSSRFGKLPVGPVGRFIRL